MTKKVTQKLPKKSAKSAVGKHPNSTKHHIKKGEVRNPKGAGAHNHFAKYVRKLSVQSLAEITDIVVNMPSDEAEKLINDPKLSLAQKAILRASIDAAHHGEIDKFNTIVSRCVGKIADKVEVSSPDGSMSPSNKLDDDELKKAINEKIDQLQSIK